MDNLLYKLWSDGTEVGAWTEPADAHEAARDYVRDNPEELRFLQLSLCQTTSNGLKILHTVRGADIETYLSDLGMEVDEDEDE